MKVLKLFLIVALFISCKETNKEQVVGHLTKQVNAPQEHYDLKVYDYNGLKPLLNKKDNKTYVVNFWATWCAPCIKELPYFEELRKEYKNKDVEVILVSLDFPNQYKKRLIPFITKHKLQSKVVALDDTDQDTWIPAINENWTGALPATLIYNRNKREFFEKSFVYKELEHELKQFLNK